MRSHKCFIPLSCQLPLQICAGPQISGGKIKRYFRAITRTWHLSERVLSSSSALSLMTSSRDGASMRLRCSGLGSVIFAFSRALTRRSASTWTCVQPSGCSGSAGSRTTWRKCLSLKAHPIYLMLGMLETILYRLHNMRLPYRQVSAHPKRAHEAVGHKRRKWSPLRPAVSKAETDV
jgi:hypothetical protein